MKNNKQGSIRSLTTGVPGLDTVLGGGLPEYSFNLLAGGPGAGKTTLAHQIMFANATAERPALYFTVLGEPTLKMLRYQRQFSFFNSDLAGSAIQFINLSEEVMDRDLDDVLKRIVDEVERREARDGFCRFFPDDRHAQSKQPSMTRARRSTGSCSDSHFTSPAGKSRHSFSANMRSRSSGIPYSLSPMEYSGSRRRQTETQWCESFR
jgi:hypothetical protein